MDIEKYRNLSLLDLVYTNIKDSILSGKYAPGQRLVVSELSKELGVSHTPINESLNRLVAEGYVEFMPRRGMKVKELELEEILEVMEVRNMFEMYCAPKIIGKAESEPAYLETLEEYVGLMCNAGYETVNKDYKAFFDIETKFHLALVEASNNKKLVQMYSNLKANSFFYYKIVCGNMIFTPERYKSACDEHREIVEAVKFGDPDSLIKAINKHMQNTMEYLRSFPSSK